MTKEQINDELNPRRKARRLISAIALILAVVVILLIMLDSKPKSTGQNIDSRDKAGELILGAAVSEVAGIPSFAASAVEATPAPLAMHGMAQIDTTKPFAAPRKQPVAVINPKAKYPIKAQITVNKTPESKSVDKPVAAQPPESDVAPAASNTAPPQKNIQDTPNISLAYEDIGIGEFGDPKKINRNWKEKKLAALIDRRSDWFSSAIDIRSRSGTAGLSQFNSVEIPLEYKTPWHSNDEVFFRVDLVKLSTGTVTPTNERFGSMLLCQPTCTPTLLPQAAQGVSLTAGYQRDNLHADIGVTPPNFPVSNIVGGIRQKGDFGKLSYSLEVSRRPVTSSLLSFAGTKDPRTGNVWGGVVATGGRLGLSLDKGETFGFWSSAGLHNLTGCNVQSSGRFQLMAGGQWRVINEENRLFSLGLTGMYWHHTQNAGEYTFGHGGYYSPLNYRSLSLPITFAERFPRFSYMLRAAVSTSQSQTRDAPFFPTNSQLQAQSANSIYAGGPGHGTGQSLKAAWEYQVEPKLFVGGLLSLDRSESYAPNRLLFYMRYSLDQPAAQPVFMSPEPIEPSSQF